MSHHDEYVKEGKNLSDDRAGVECDSKNGRDQSVIYVVTRRIAFGAVGVGGMERAAAAQVRMAIDQGFDVRLITPRAAVSGQPPSDVAIVNVDWPSWNHGTGRASFGLAYWVWSRRVSDVLASSPPAITHFHGASVNALRFLGPNRSSRPTIANPHGLEEFGRFSLKRLPNRLFTRRMARACRYADIVISTDDLLTDLIKMKLRISDAQIRLIPNTVNVAALQDLAIGYTAFTAFTIVTVGRIVSNKGYDILVEALKDQTVRNLLPPDYRWLHFGSGPLEDSLVSLAKKHPQIPLAVVVGATDVDVQRALSQASLFVQPSRHEGSSISTLEAMAHGRKIVATAVGGIPGKVWEGKTGFLAEQPSARHLAAAITRAYGSESATGLAARSRVLEEFSAQVEMEAYARLYDDVSLPGPTPHG